MSHLFVFSHELQQLLIVVFFKLFLLLECEINPNLLVLDALFNFIDILLLLFRFLELLLVLFILNLLLVSNSLLLLPEIGDKFYVYFLGVTQLVKLWVHLLELDRCWDGCLQLLDGRNGRLLLASADRPSLVQSVKIFQLFSNFILMLETLCQL